LHGKAFEQMGMLYEKYKAYYFTNNARLHQ
jgi:hypothetical protein